MSPSYEDMIREIRENQIDMRNDVASLNKSVDRLVEVQYEMIKVNESISYLIERTAKLEDSQTNGCSYAKVTNQRLDNVDKKLSVTNKTLLGVGTAAIAAFIRSLF